MGKYRLQEKAIFTREDETCVVLYKWVNTHVVWAKPHMTYDTCISNTYPIGTEKYFECIDIELCNHRRIHDYGEFTEHVLIMCEYTYHDGDYQNKKYCKDNTPWDKIYDYVMNFVHPIDVEDTLEYVMNKYQPHGCGTV